MGLLLGNCGTFEEIFLEKFSTSCHTPFSMSQVCVHCWNGLMVQLVECLCQVVDDVVDVFRAYAQADGGGRDVLLGQFLGREL